MTQQAKLTALVTGASSGIGAEAARILAARGLRCVLTARREERLRALADELADGHGAEVQVIAQDLAEPGAAAALHQRVAALGWPVDVLVNNAGLGVYGDFLDQTPERVARMIQLNVVALTELTRLFALDMRERGHGHVLQLASIAAFQPAPLYAVYAATKSYVLSFSQALDYELRGTGVSVTTLNPGMTDTEFHQVAQHIKPPSIERLSMSARAVARVGVEATFRRRRVVTAGWLNKLTGGFVKLIPQRWATAAAAASMRMQAPALPADHRS